jgi:hypothetical protein
LTPSIAQIFVLLRLPEVKPGKRIPLPNPLSISDQNLLLIYMVALTGYPAPPQALPQPSPKGILIDALENAQATRLTPEEAETYLKNVLKVDKNPTVENFNVTTLIGDAREDSTLVPHGLPWTLVTRHRTKHAKVKPGRPTVEGVRADRNWRIEPGLYDARLQKSFYRSASTPTTKRDKNNYKRNS